MRHMLLVLTLLLLVAGCSSPPAGNMARVTSVTDGDTFDVRIHNRTDTVRVLGIDTPETHVRNEKHEYASITDTGCLRAYGERADERARKMLANETVQLIYGKERRGYYDRLLAYVHLDGTDLGRVLIKEGLARVYNESDFSRKAEYKRLQQDARAEKRGLWSCVG